MLEEVYTKQCKKDIKLLRKQGKDKTKFDEIVLMLKQEIPLPVLNRDHALTNNWKGCRECHIEPDWLLIYEVSKKNNTLTLLRTGSHSELLEDLNMLQKLDNIIYEALK